MIKSRPWHRAVVGFEMGNSQGKLASDSDAGEFFRCYPSILLGFGSREEYIWLTSLFDQLISITSVCFELLEKVPLARFGSLNVKTLV